MWRFVFALTVGLGLVVLGADLTSLKGAGSRQPSGNLWVPAWHDAGQVLEIDYDVNVDESDPIYEVDVSGSDGFDSDWYDPNCDSDFAGSECSNSAQGTVYDDLAGSFDGAISYFVSVSFTGPPHWGNIGPQISQPVAPRPSRFVVFWQGYDNSYPSNNNGGGYYTCQDGGPCNGIVAGTSNTWFYHANDQLYDQWGNIYQQAVDMWEDMSVGTNGCTVNDINSTQQSKNFQSQSDGTWWDEFWAFVGVWCQTGGSSDCSFQKTDTWIVAPNNRLDVQILNYSGASFSLSHTCVGTGCGG